MRGSAAEKTAPIAAAPSMATTASMPLGSHAATRSPSPTPSLVRAAAIAPTSTPSSSQDIVAEPVSDSAMIAGSLPVRRSTCSTMLSEASGNSRASGMDDPGSSTVPPGSPTRPHSSQTAGQNRSGSEIDRRWSAS